MSLNSARLRVQVSNLKRGLRPGPIGECFSIALKFLGRLLVSMTPLRGRDKLEHEARWLIMNHARIVSSQVLQKPVPEVLGFIDVYAKGAEETVDSGRFGAHSAKWTRVEIDTYDRDFLQKESQMCRSSH